MSTAPESRAAASRVVDPMVGAQEGIAETVTRDRSWSALLRSRSTLFHRAAFFSSHRPLAYPPAPSFGYCVSMNRQNRALNLRRFSATSNHVRCKAPSVATLGYHVSRRVGSELPAQRSTTVSRKFQVMKA